MDQIQLSIEIYEYLRNLTKSGEVFRLSSEAQAHAYDLRHRLFLTLPEDYKAQYVLGTD